MNPMIKQFNRFATQNQSLIQKALTSVAGTGEALIPQQLEKIVTDTVIRLSPEIALITPKENPGKFHEFNRLVARPAPGGAMGENATTPSTNSRTVRDSVELKIVRRKGKVTNFLNDASRQYIDSASYEMQNHLQAHVLDMIYYMLYGNKDGNVWEFDGLDKFIKTNRFNSFTVPTTLKVLDDLIDASNRKGGARHRRAFGMSPEMLSKFSQLLTNVRLNQGIVGNGITQIDINGGWRLNAYRDIPIIETTSTRPIEAMRPTVTLAGEDTGVGSLSDGNYFVRVAPLTLEGEQQPCAEATVTLSGGTATQRIDVQLSDIHKNIDGEVSALGYKVYVGVLTGVYGLNKITTAYVFDAEGSPIANRYVGVGADKLFISSLTPGADVPVHMRSDTPLLPTGLIPSEVIYLWDLDPIQGLGKVPYANSSGDQFNGLVTTKPLAEVDDYIQFMVKTYGCITPAFEATSCWVRGLRTA